MRVFPLLRVRSDTRSSPLVVYLLAFQVLSPPPPFISLHQLYYQFLPCALWDFPYSLISSHTGAWSLGIYKYRQCLYSPQGNIWTSTTRGHRKTYTASSMDGRSETIWIDGNEERGEEASAWVEVLHSCRRLNISTDISINFAIEYWYRPGLISRGSSLSVLELLVTNLCIGSIRCILKWSVPSSWKPWSLTVSQGPVGDLRFVLYRSSTEIIEVWRD